MKATLTYHSIDDSESPVSLAPATFQRHVAWLASGRVKVLGLDALLAHPEDGEDAVALTFDDGFLNNDDPVRRLLDAGLPATLFVVSRYVGTTNAWGGYGDRRIPVLPLLSWDDLGGLIERGASVAAHSRTHAPMTSLSPFALDDELLGCVDDLHTRLGLRASHLAYPYGDVDERVAARAEHHFRFGHTTAFDMLRSTAPRLQLPRLDMYYFQKPGTLEAWGTPAFARRVSWCRTRRRARAWLVGS